MSDSDSDSGENDSNNDLYDDEGLKNGLNYVVNLAVKKVTLKNMKK